MKKIFYSIIASICIFGASSCSDMLDNDSSRLVSDPEINSKTDSIFYAYGVMQAMQQLADQYFFQNEMRGELVYPTQKATTHLKTLADFSATTENKYDSVYLYYKVINNCNYYLAKRDTTLESGTRKVTINEFANIAAFRAWAYLQVTSQYGDVPYVTEPLTTISQINENTAKTDYKQILAGQAEYMQALKDRYAPEYLDAPIYNNAAISMGHMNYDNKATKDFYAKKCFVPFNVVLGDLYLEIGEYSKAANCYYDYLVHAVASSGLDKPTAIGNNYSNSIQPERNDFRLEDLTDYLKGSSENSLDNGPRKWNQIFSTNNDEIISYVPMAVNYTMGQTTEIPQAFGYDFYATKSSHLANYSISNCPETEVIQLKPSNEYASLAYESPYYYGTTTRDPMSKTTRYIFSSVNKGDGRANFIAPSMLSTDTSEVYVQKPSTGFVYLYRNSTVYMHLAEALNRLGEPEIAFAILKKGMNKNIAEIVDTAAYQYEGGVPKLDDDGNRIVKDEGIPTTNFFVPKASYDKLKTGEGGVPPFLGPQSAVYFTNSSSNEIVGMHYHGAGAVDHVRSTYTYKSLVEGRIDAIRAKFGLPTGEYSKEEYINAVEDLLCDEYALEFAFEGRRFSDLLRLARHKNAAGTYNGVFGDMWLSSKLASKAAGITTKNCYLPFK